MQNGRDDAHRESCDQQGDLNWRTKVGHFQGSSPKCLLCVRNVQARRPERPFWDYPAGGANLEATGEELQSCVELSVVVEPLQSCQTLQTYLALLEKEIRQQLTVSCDVTVNCRSVSFLWILSNRNLWSDVLLSLLNFKWYKLRRMRERSGSRALWEEQENKHTPLLVNSRCVWLQTACKKTSDSPYHALSIPHTLDSCRWGRHHYRVSSTLQSLLYRWPWFLLLNHCSKSTSLFVKHNAGFSEVP